MTTTTQYLVESISKHGGYDYHRPQGAWNGTYDTLKEAEHAADMLKITPAVVAVGIRRLDAPQKIKHGSYGQLNCGGGTLTTIRYELSPHEVYASGSSPMALHRQAFRASSPEEYLACAQGAKTPN